MSDIPYYKWKPGVADEAWKLMICARDYKDAEGCMERLIYLLTRKWKQEDYPEALNELKQMSGKEIIERLQKCMEINLQSINNGMKKHES